MAHHRHHADAEWRKSVTFNDEGEGKHKEEGERQGRKNSKGKKKRKPLLAAEDSSQDDSEDSDYIG